MTDKTYDVIMVGGGLMGCAIAYYLMKADDGLKVAIVEMDPTYEKSSTSLSDGNVRVQFMLKENIQISQYGLEVIERFAEEMAVDDDRPDVAFRREGNLFLVDEIGREEAEQASSAEETGLPGRVVDAERDRAPLSPLSPDRLCGGHVRAAGWHAGSLDRADGLQEEGRLPRRAIRPC
jgi:glycine/D-amino acid oxidase-like deaminating enzyme